MKTHLTGKLITLVVLLAIAAVGASAQTQTTTNATTAAALPASSADPLATTAEPMFPTRAPAAPAAQGEGSTQNSYVWVRGYIFKVHRSKGNPALINADGASNVSSVDDFDYGTEKAIKAQGGWNHPTLHFGFRLSYFHSNQKADESRLQGAAAPFIVSPRPLNVTFTGAPDTGTTATFEERFRLQVVDLEGSYKWTGSNFSAVGSVGLRIARSRQTYEARDIFGGTPEFLQYTQRRNGLGPTIGVDGRYRIGSSSFYVTGAGRLSILFGTINEDASFASGAFLETASRNLRRATPVFEGEGGLEWSAGPWFVNGSFIVHHWHHLVNVMPTPTVGSFAITPLDPPTNPPSQEGSVRFVGGAFSVGFRF